MLSFPLRWRPLRLCARQQLVVGLCILLIFFFFHDVVFDRGLSDDDSRGVVRSKELSASLEAQLNSLQEEEEKVRGMLDRLKSVKEHVPENQPSGVGEKKENANKGGKTSNNKQPEKQPPKRKWKPPNVPDRADTTDEEQAKHHLAIVVPYRDREANLKDFLSIVTDICVQQNLKFHIFIVEQTEMGGFNRAKLCNIGYEISTKLGYDYIVFHDVDKVPVTANVSYRWPGDGMVHMASCVEQFDFKLPYYSFLGGVVMFRADHIKRFNGMSNFFWGWGAEDDDTWVRMKRVRIRLTRAKNCEAGRFRSLPHLRSKYSYPQVQYNSNYKIYRELLKRRRRFQDDGLSSLVYKVLDKKTFEHHDIIRVDVCQGDLGRKTRAEAGCDGPVLVDPTAPTVSASPSIHPSTCPPILQLVCFLILGALIWIVDPAASAR